MLTVKAGRSTATYFIAEHDHVPPSRMDLNNYRQRDVHTCGFVAALTVVHHFYPETPAKDVLAAVRPSLNWGVNYDKLMGALRKLGIDAEYRGDLVMDDLRTYVDQNVPVIVSVWPEEWMSDHWTVVWGFDDTVIHLTNHGHMTLDEFYEIWSDFDMRGGRGASQEGIMCSPRAHAD